MFHWRFVSKTLSDEDCFFGKILKIRNTSIKICWGPVVPHFRILLISRMSRYEKIILFEDVPIFSYIFQIILVINTGSEGP